MSAPKSLTAALQKQVLRLEDDLRARVEQDESTRQSWQAGHREAISRRRTASAWQAWRDDRVTQAAVAWVLTTVFVRFCEDNRLVEPVWLVGPAERRQEALDAELAFYREQSQGGADVTARDWLLQAVDHLASLKATTALVDQHAALHLVQPSGDAAGALVAFWRERGDDGALTHDFTDTELDTRFLGDLYQDLSEHAKATFALLQTPEFVEEFILDQTLEPALAERPLKGFRLIDPTCGSGHFLLGAFDRLLDRWQRHAPGMERQALVQAALDAIHGVDLNPFAVAIARFRLTVAALQASGLRSLEDAPGFGFHLAVGDSLLHGAGQQTLQEDADLSGFTYATEDLAVLRAILADDTYDVVVGNPPYITVKDKELNREYRERYPRTCKGTYAMTVPFMERFYRLAREGRDSQAAGWTGQITSNSFMKREFGSRLIENFLVTRDLRLVADISGAYIPGHGTPTAILVGRNQRPVGSTVRAVLGVRGEPGRPEDAANGVVWRTVVDHVDQAGWDDDWISVTDLTRESLSRHPWSLSGGGATQLVEQVEAAGAGTLGDVIAGKIGFASFPGADDCFFAPQAALRRDGVPLSMRRPVITGEVVRDWGVGVGDYALTPYDAKANLLPLDTSARWARRQWRNRTILASTTGFGGETKASSGAPWWGWYRWVAERYSKPLSITFAEVATHNHFALDRGERVFKQTAPVIKLRADASEDEHLALLGVLNSSTACFWLKQVCFSKGNGGIGGGIGDEAWEPRYAFNGANIADVPLPAALPLSRAHRLDSLGTEADRTISELLVEHGPSLSERMLAVAAQAKLRRERMISLQEELDWEVYGLYGLIDEDLTCLDEDLPGLALGERAFEIALARRVQRGEEKTAWFSRHGAAPITEIPMHWPARYRELVQRRLDLIMSDPAIRLLEKPEYKRRWASESWEKRQAAALRDWLLDRLEGREYWFDRQGRPAPRSVAQLADEVARDEDMVSVLALWEGRPDVPVVQSLSKLLADEAVPYLAAFRYKDSGLRKREAWEQTWALQRREDAERRWDQSISVPPKYAPADFRKVSYWQARGKLDVPKERFILYPDAGRETDPTVLLGWAGWDHAQQSLALSVVVGAREADGWDDSRLVPLVAGLAELQPWVEQWHADVDPAFGVSLAGFCREQLTARASQVGKTLDELAAWRPEPAARGRRPRGSAS
ncbi:BREX-2 system adenine-specific DNA-methyltransferase PglX [Modestobacter sp. VKM Ac-2985]|uniref:BREX-2 system adenine-specific DNA-methyltransferase PglX n=1 Tax=Modestobacter sp. VKM Ac-2985 TaxID=3004139 RepID=UPI0022AB87B2|nr:BREX-2 system adenine-specific DNA-methyltransferase PglX [Modestobacter sp. VKM Ac-2985]MCZ2839924.1 BREX-2 system adenine-specific DNA-methyltransferase PglX [Modestobacter sp. VKM Ac-2985]